MAVLSESPCLAKRSNKNFETFRTKINKLKRGNLNYNSNLDFQSCLKYQADNLKKNLIEIIIIIMLDCMLLTFENLDLITSCGTVLITIERSETTADKPSPVSVASRVVSKAAKYSVEVSSPPWSFMTSVTAAKMAFSVIERGLVNRFKSNSNSN